MHEKKDGEVTRRQFLKNGAVVGVGATAFTEASEQEVASERSWDRVVDVVVLGAGASGLPAAIRARDLGASVIVLEENTDIGGHAIISGGNVRLGGGNTMQRKFGVEDSPDMIYTEYTRPDHPQTRYNDRAVVRAFADAAVATFDFLVANGVKFVDSRPEVQPIDGMITPRSQTTVRWSDDLRETINGTNGSGLMRALEQSARSKGVDIRLEHRATSIVREGPRSGRVLGVTATSLRDDTTVSIRAAKAVIAATGGSSSNVFLRTVYDPRLSEEYQVGCEPYSRQSGDAEQMGMAIGASLGGTAIQTTEARSAIQKTAWIGCRYGYARWNPESPVFDRAGASGISVADYQDVILVNQLGQRFYDEMAAGLDRTPDSGCANVYDYIAAALGSVLWRENGVLTRRGGPIWAIFDADAARREDWVLEPPFVDPNGYYFRGDTLGELAAKIASPYQKFSMPPANLEATVAGYNTFVDMRKDPDFGKPTPLYKIQTPPFHAAWATPILHDTYAGLRVNGRFQVLDVVGGIIPGLYCVGESAGGFNLHGLGRATAGGYIAGTHAAAE